MNKSIMLLSKKYEYELPLIVKDKIKSGTCITLIEGGSKEVPLGYRKITIFSFTFYFYVLLS